MESDTRCQTPHTSAQSTGSPIHCQANKISGYIHDLGWEQSGGESVPAAAEIVHRLWEICMAAAKPWSYRGGRQLGRVRGQAQGRYLRGFDGTGGTWSGQTPSIRHLSPISTPGRRGMLLAGGVAGAEPPHKGGPNRPDRPEMQWSVVSGLTTGWDGSEDWTRVSRYVMSTKEYPHLGCTRISGLNLQGEHVSDHL